MPVCLAELVALKSSMPSTIQMFYFQMENQREFTNTPQPNTEDLVGVRSEGNSSYMGRNHHGSVVGLALSPWFRNFG